MSQVVQVETVSSEDRWSVRLLNVLTHLHQLLRKGKTREMFVWGHFKVVRQPFPESPWWPGSALSARHIE